MTLKWNKPSDQTPQENTLLHLSVKTSEGIQEIWGRYERRDFGMAWVLCIQSKFSDNYLAFTQIEEPYKWAYPLKEKDNAHKK